MVCTARNPTLGWMIDLCEYRHHGLRCSSICFQPNLAKTVCIDMCICTDHDVDWTYHRMAQGKGGIAC